MEEGFIQIGKHSTLAVHITSVDFTLHKINLFYVLNILNFYIYRWRMIILLAGYNEGFVKCDQVMDVGRVRQSTAIHCQFRLVYSKLG